MYFSVSWYPWDIDLPRGQYFWGVPEYHFSPRPRAAELHSTPEQLGMKGCFSSSGSSFFPSPLQGQVIGFSSLQVFVILIQFPSSAQEAPILGTVSSLLFQAECMFWPAAGGAVYGWCLSLCLEHIGEGTSIVQAHNQWWRWWQWLPLLLL